jgi:hypothetical protein
VTFDVDILQFLIKNLVRMVVAAIVPLPTIVGSGSGIMLLIIQSLYLVVKTTSTVAGIAWKSCYSFDVV